MTDGVDASCPPHAARLYFPDKLLAGFRGSGLSQVAPARNVSGKSTAAWILPRELSHVLQHFVARCDIMRRIGSGVAETTRLAEGNVWSSCVGHRNRLYNYLLWYANAAGIGSRLASGDPS
jgi:hypothetical protein